MAAKASPEKRKLPPPKPLFSDESIALVLEGTRDILEGRSFLSTAQHGEQFEKDFALYCGVDHAVCCSNGTTALEIALRALGVEGGEVLVPTLTFAATAYAVRHAGARPVFVDCGPDMQMDPEQVAGKITPDTRAVVTVHVGGYLSETLPALQELCSSKGLPLVEDAAHAHGSRLGGTRAGAFGLMSAFSFFSTKVVASGEGGAVVTRDDDLAAKARLLRNQGKDRNTNYHTGPGLSARLTEMQALVLRAQLSELDEQIAARTAVARVYDEALADTEGLSLFPDVKGLEPNYYKYLAFLDQPGHQAAFKQALKEEWNVGLTGFVYELPLHRQPVFAPHVGSDSACPVADDLARRHVCLPAHPGMSTEDAAYVAHAVKTCLPRFLEPVEGDPPFLLP